MPAKAAKTSSKKYKPTAPASTGASKDSATASTKDEPQTFKEAWAKAQAEAADKRAEKQAAREKWRMEQAAKPVQPAGPWIGTAKLRVSSDVEVHLWPSHDDEDPAPVVPLCVLRKGVSKDSITGTATLMPPGGGSWTVSGISLQLHTIVWRLTQGEWVQLPPIGTANVTSFILPKPSASKPLEISGEHALPFDIPRRALAPSMLPTYSSDGMCITHELELKFSAGTRSKALYLPLLLYCFHHCALASGEL